MPFKKAECTVQLTRLSEDYLAQATQSEPIHSEGAATMRKCSHSRKLLPPCRICSAKKCYACAGMKKEEVDKIRSGDEGYTCRDCPDGDDFPDGVPSKGWAIKIMKRLAELEDENWELTARIKELERKEEVRCQKDKESSDWAERLGQLEEVQEQSEKKVEKLDQDNKTFAEVLKTGLEE